MVSRSFKWMGSSSGAGNITGDSSNASKGSMADQLVSSALRYRAQSPLVDSLLGEIGLNGGDLNGMTEVLKSENGANVPIGGKGNLNAA